MVEIWSSVAVNPWTFWVGATAATTTDPSAASRCVAPCGVTRATLRSWPTAECPSATRKALQPSAIYAKNGRKTHVQLGPGSTGIFLVTVGGSAGGSRVMAKYWPAIPTIQTRTASTFRFALLKWQWHCIGTNCNE